MKSVPRILRQARRAAERRSAFGSSPAWGGPSSGVSAYLPSPVLSGVAVTPETALTFTAVFCAINTLATDTASLPLRVMRSLKTGGRAPAESDPRFDLVSLQPNAKSTSIRFRMALMGHVVSWGNGYSEIERDPNGYPVGFHLHSPRPMDTYPFETKSGELRYKADGGRREILAEDVIHVAGLGWDGLCGYSPVAMARQAIGLGIAAEQFGAAFFGNSATPAGFLKKPGKVTVDQARNIRESWDAVHQGTSNAHRVAVLEEGLEWQSISIPPEDAQFLGTRQFQVIEIARMFRLPPHKLGDYSHSHLANIEESNLDYLNTTLGPWLETIEQELNRKLFTSRERAHGLHVLHDTSALLRGNASARATIYGQLFDRAAISPDEIRQREGFNPLPEDAGKAYFYSVNSQPLWSARELEPPADTTTQGDSAGGVGDAGDDGGRALARRHNPNHGKNGQFASGRGGGPAAVAARLSPEKVARDHADLKEAGKELGVDLSVRVSPPSGPKEAVKAADLAGKGKVLIRKTVEAQTVETKAGNTTEHKVAGDLYATTRPNKLGGFTSETNQVSAVPGRKSFGTEAEALEHSRRKTAADVKRHSETSHAVAKAEDGGVNDVSGYLHGDEVVAIGKPLGRLPAEHYKTTYHLIKPHGVD